ncbi:MAG: chromate transporter [Peptostreptococcales bacterium]
MKNNIYFKLFTSTFLLSAFTFGGGYVIVPLMKKKFVDHLNWIEDDEMLNMIAIAQSSPGAVAINASILIGYRMGGFVGAAVTILGSILPPLITLSVISYFYISFRENQIIQGVLKGMQAGITAVIADVVLNLGNNILRKKQSFSTLTMFAAFVAAFYFKVNVIYIILVCAFIGFFQWFYDDKKGMI